MSERRGGRVICFSGEKRWKLKENMWNSEGRGNVVNGEGFGKRLRG